MHANCLMFGAVDCTADKSLFSNRIKKKMIGQKNNIILALYGATELSPVSCSARVLTVNLCAVCVWC